MTTRTFYNGRADLIAKVAATALKVTFFNGDGCQAPGAAVIRQTKEDRGDGKPEYAVHFANTQCGGYHGGSYVTDYATALDRFDERLTRYDPDGSRRASYEQGTGVDKPALAEA